MHHGSGLFPEAEQVSGGSLGDQCDRLSVIENSDSLIGVDSDDRLVPRGAEQRPHLRAHPEALGERQHDRCGAELPSERLDVECGVAADFLGHVPDHDDLHSGVGALDVAQEDRVIGVDVLVLVDDKEVVLFEARPNRFEVVIEDLD